jgi:hypothetical protein
VSSSAARTIDPAPAGPAVPPLVLRAAQDPEVRGRSLSVLVLLHELLSTAEFRSVRPWYIAQRMGMSRQNVSTAISRLEAGGFIVPGPIDGNYRSFRLFDPLTEA